MKPSFMATFIIVSMDTVNKQGYMMPQSEHFTFFPQLIFFILFKSRTKKSIKAEILV